MLRMRKAWDTTKAIAKYDVMAGKTLSQRLGTMALLLVAALLLIPFTFWGDHLIRTGIMPKPPRWLMGVVLFALWMLMCALVGAAVGFVRGWRERDDD